MKSIDMSAIDLNLLVAFEALFEERSVTGAAKRLHLGQPAMSAALGRLRTVFEDELFIRIGKEMQPTSKALEIASEILAALELIRHTIKSSQVFDPVSSQRSFTMGSPDYTSYVVIPPMLEFCSQKASGLNFRLIGYEKDSVGELLERGTIDIALGVFPNPPLHTNNTPLFQEHFVGIARKGHPAIINGSMFVETFASLPHALVTLRRDATGEIDKALARLDLQRRIAITIPHMLVLPAIIAKNDLIAAIPYRVAARFASLHCLEIFELPVQTEPWAVSMLWSKLADKDPANSWLRQTLKTICEGL
ncbi:LysR family transcriptional regulator [Iningainema tapete]|uniref:LysR family transcriptional regulator n=1 Tax=Iningainema tapete BLCC-T55 TaxID=2748662 RepID=A0A8J7CGZ2_9CYAN|nr:LysR family transcriptional regulator [Iningainema tapete]MBD2777015.1 LysR family transcriptional regulator [Iningainema tapete BLCC-T55]